VAGVIVGTTPLIKETVEEWMDTGAVISVEGEAVAILSNLVQVRGGMCSIVIQM